MPATDWSVSVEDAVRRLSATIGSNEFTRADLIETQLPRIVEETGSTGKTPEMTLSRELQQLRDRGIIEFLDDRGSYRLAGKGSELRRS